MKALLNLFGLGQSCAQAKQTLQAINQALPLIEINANGDITQCNEVFARLLGYDEAMLIAKNHHSLVSSETQGSSDYQAIWRSIEQGRVYNTELCYQTRSGEEKWLSASISPVGAANSGRAIACLTDVTDYKQRLQENSKTANLANALKLCQANVMLADLDFNIVYMNDTVTAMLSERERVLKTELPDFDVKSLVGKNVDSFHKNPSHQRGMIAKLEKPFETQIKVAGLTFSLITSPWYDLEGNRIGTLVEWLDMTEQLQQEEKLAEISAENLRVRQSLDACNTSVMIADEDLRIVYINKAVQEMLKNRETELRRVLPNFDADNLVGTCVDDFHKNPNHQRGVLGSLKTPYKTDIEVAGLTMGLIATPILDEQGERKGTVVEWDDKTDRLAIENEAKRLAAENVRVKQALDSVTTNVMIADGDANIVYLNKAVVGMMQHAESDIRSEIKNFNAQQLLGQNMDIFHKNPAHQRRLVEGLKSTYRGKASVGGRQFNVIANPVYMGDQRIGTVVEWEDKTAELQIEEEVNQMVVAAGLGDFTKQIQIEGKDGFFKSLAVGLNSLVGTVEVALNDILRMFGAMSKGDLSERITRDYNGAFGQLKDDANETADKLTEVITNIRRSSGAILTASNEIAQGNTDLGQRTEEQASSLEETASSMEEMTSTVRQSAANAQKASSLSEEAQRKASEGGEVVSRAIEAMNEINASSKKISDIIGVIDEIAFQTNLLALNAAVEAARAGEQGRGFAVVAGEVRNLAQRSAGAAKEIKDLIRDSVSKVQDGSELVNESGQTLGEIVASVENVQIMMRDIAMAAQEQTSGIEQVNTAVSQMDEMTQQNAALVEEATAAGAALAEQANAMNQIVSFFSASSEQDFHSPTPSVSAQSHAHFSSKPSVSRPSQVKQAPPAPKRPAAQSDDDEWEDF